MGCCASKEASLGGKVAKWRTTGIIGLRDSNLKALPTIVLELGAAVRTLDATSNKLGLSKRPRNKSSQVKIPAEIECLVSLQRLMLAENLLESIPSTIGLLQSLKVLTLDGNKLLSIPQEVGLLVRLERLSLSGNFLSSLPDTIGSLRNLVLLDVSHNQLKHLPASLGSCFALEEVVGNANMIEELPATLCNLARLKSLILDGNKLVKLPVHLFRDCKSLQTLSLHATPITIEQLQEMDDYALFEARRRKKIDKRIDTNVLMNAGYFDEGVDRK